MALGVEFFYRTGLGHVGRYTNSRFFAVAVAIGVLALVLPASMAAAQPGLNSDEEVPTIAWHASFDPADAAPGDTVTLRVWPEPPPGAYTYPMTDDNFAYATEIEITGHDGILEPAGDWIDGKWHTDDAGTKILDRGAVFARPYKIAAGATAATHAIRVAIDHMPCTKNACYDALVTTVTATLTVKATTGDAGRTATGRMEFGGLDLNTDSSTGTDPGETDAQPNGGTVRFTARIEPAAVAVGETVRVIVTARIPEGSHIYPTEEQEHVMNTAITFTDAPAFLEPLGPWRDPATKLDHDIKIVAGTVDFIREFRAKSPIADATLKFEIEYLACLDDGVCLPPAVGTATATLTIRPSSVPGDSGAAPSTPPTETPTTTTTTATGTTTGTAPPPPPMADTDIPEFNVWFLLAAIGAAWASLLTPCVFPMIPITISHFVNLAQARAKKMAAETAPTDSPSYSAPTSKQSAGWYQTSLALTYGAGIIITFSVVALVLMIVMKIDVGTAVGSSWELMLALGVIVLAFALSFFGLFEITLPSGLVSKFQGGGNKGPYIGTFVMGAGFTLASFACTGPILGFLVIMGAQGAPAWQPAVGVIVYAVAFALPFVLLGMAPTLMAKLPRSGVWMIKVKVIMAFLMLIFAIGFFATADQILEAGLFGRSLVLSLWAAVLFAFGLYLFGKLHFKLEKPADKNGPIATVAAILVFGIGFHFLGAAQTGVPVFGTLEAMLPAVEPQIAARTQPPAIVAGPSTPIAPSGIPRGEHDGWFTNYEAGLSAATQAAVRAPLFVEFTGHYCKNCKENRRNVLPDPRVQALMAKMVWTEIYTDALRNAGPDERAIAAKNKAVADRFGAIAQPTYLIIDPATETVLARHRGSTTVAAFSAFLNEGLQKFDAATKP